MKKLFLGLTLLVAVQCSPGAIHYFPGPSFQIGGGGVDFDGNGAAECAFTSGGMICTADIPVSFCAWPFQVRSGGAGEMLLSGSGVALLPSGSWISAQPPSGASWSAPDTSADLVVFQSSQRNPAVRWAGPLADAQAGCLGVQFMAADGLHFGWIRVRLPLTAAAPNGFPVEFLPVVVDWAYETSPNTPIKAGQVDDSIFFTANLSGANEVPPNQSGHSGTGTFTLESFVDGYALIYRLELAGTLVAKSAGIFGPASREERPPRLIADLGYAQIVFQPPPPIGLVPFSPVPTSLNQSDIVLPPPTAIVYEGLLALSSNQVVQLLCGQLFVDLKSLQFPRGELRGQLWPADPILFSATLSGRNIRPRNNSPHGGEALFTLTGATLAGELALDGNFSWKSIGIYASPVALPGTLVAALTNVIGVVIPPGGFPGEPGLPGQGLYDEHATLTDRQVNQLKNGRFYLQILTPRFPRGEIGGRIIPPAK